jgi:hypothetical protein|tara:strand:- start:448 stop:1050 length:603 start_codon:yes stop_codon:yes gene_type:complete
MSWAIVKNNQVIEILNGAKAVTINGIQYPSSIFSAWTKADLKNIGIYPTQITSTLDNRTHVGTGGVTYTVNTDHVAIHYAKKAHVLEDVSVTTDGKSMLTKGLKTKLLEQVDNNAYKVLAPSDWMTTRQMETGVTIADDWKTWRASVRTQAKAMKTAINAVTTITDVPGLYVTYATASDGTMTSVASGHLWHWPVNPDEA